MTGALLGAVEEEVRTSLAEAREQALGAGGLGHWRSLLLEEVLRTLEEAGLSPKAAEEAVHGALAGHPDLTGRLEGLAYLTRLGHRTGALESHVQALVGS